MGARFLACAWDPASGAPDRLARAQDLLSEAFGDAPALSGKGFVVWTRPDIGPPVSALPCGGALIGRLHGGAPTTARSPATASATASARQLIASSWGSYVGLLRDAGARPWWVVRDPSGAVDAITWRLGDLLFAADDLQGAPPILWPARLGLDWGVIARIVQSPLAAAGRSALADVVAVAPGDLQPLGGDAREAIALWRPREAARVAGPADPEAHLRALVPQVVTALGAAHGPLIVETSGGLDSSIVALSLAQGPAAAQARAAFNQYAVEPDSDERPYARLVCARAGLCLRAEVKPIGRIEAADLGALAQGFRPPVSALDLIRDRVLLGLADEVGARAVMTGQGGDAVFFQMPAAHVVADLWRDRGPGRQFLTGLTETARWLRRSAWSILDEARRPRDQADISPLRAFAGPAVLGLPPRAPHPWLEGLEATPPGKAIQIEALTAAQLKFGPSLRRDRLEVLHPLLAQPVTELCLSIPSWRHVSGGTDRALARRAFADLLPAEVAQRRAKGALTSLYTRRVAQSLDVLRPWLLDGVLADAGLLDRDAMARALTPERLLWRGDGVRLMTAAALEGWVRWWQTRVPDASDARRPRVGG